MADLSSALPHMVPSEQAFAAAMDALGVTNDTFVVLYDRVGIFSAPRAWWTFRVLGHSRCVMMLTVKYAVCCQSCSGAPRSGKLCSSQGVTARAPPLSYLFDRMWLCTSGCEGHGSGCSGRATTFDDAKHCCQYNADNSVSKLSCMPCNASAPPF